MRVVIQRVVKASVEIESLKVAEIGPGMLILVGFEEGDSTEDVDWISGKIARLRIFADSGGAMNLSLREVNGDVLVVSQFTLHASTRKGNRPSFIKAARPEKAIPLYEYFLQKTEYEIGKRPFTGIFGADMKVALVNDGPVTILIDSMVRE